MVQEKCMFAWCKGKELSWWEELFPYIYFYVPPLIFIIILFVVFVWLLRK